MCGHVPYVHVWIAQWMNGGASHQYGRIGKRTSWFVLLSILFCFVLFGRKFKASGDFWAEMLGKTVGIYKKLRGEPQAEEKQLGGNRLFAASY